MESDLNWQVDSSNGRSWKNIDSGQMVYLVTPEEFGELEPIVEENPDADWIFMGDNSVIDVLYGSESDAISEVEEWLAAHPSVSGMIS